MFWIMIMLSTADAIVIHSGKTITACCLSQLTGHFYIGTSSGNVFTLDLRSFKLVDELIFWDQATAL